MKFYFLFMSLFFSQVTLAATQPSKFLLCRNHKIVRTLRVVGSDSGCQTMYTKEGVDRIIGTRLAKHSCVKFMDNVQNNLEQAGWRCKDVRKAGFTPVVKPSDS